MLHTCSYREGACELLAFDLMSDCTCEMAADPGDVRKAVELRISYRIRTTQYRLCALRVPGLTRCVIKSHDSIARLASALSIRERVPLLCLGCDVSLASISLGVGSSYTLYVCHWIFHKPPVS